MHAKDKELPGATSKVARQLAEHPISLDRIEARVRAIARLVPITRVSDLTPIDPLRFPVYTAATPLARDLAIHGGKGPTPQAARVSAMMEAVERVSAETVDPARLQRDSFCALARTSRVLHPADCDLPEGSLYDERDGLSWLQGEELLSGRSIWVPSDLAISPPREGVLVDVDTNGLASSSTMESAILHALCEVIERDAISQLEFVELFADEPRRPRYRGILSHTLPAWARAWHDRIDAGGLGMNVDLLSNDIRVPTFRCVLHDRSFETAAGPAHASFPGFGTHPCSEVALRRALFESMQARVMFLQGARDSFNSSTFSARATTKNARARALSRREELSFTDVESFETCEPRGGLERCLVELGRAGFHRVVVVDLTRPELDIPVVRVRVPGLSCFIVNPRRVGWRCQRHLV